MKKANVQKLETVIADYLQFRFEQYLHAKKHNDTEGTEEYWAYYTGATSMLDNCSIEWRRFYNGTEDKKDLHNIDNYSHSVYLPTDARMDKWK